MPYDQRGSELLSENECHRLLASAAASERTGRLAMNREGRPYVIPVNFSVLRGRHFDQAGPGLCRPPPRWGGRHL